MHPLIASTKILRHHWYVRPHVILFPPCRTCRIQVYLKAQDSSIRCTARRKCLGPLEGSRSCTLHRWSKQLTAHHTKKFQHGVMFHSPSSVFHRQEPCGESYGSGGKAPTNISFQSFDFQGLHRPSHSFDIPGTHKVLTGVGSTS